jgi:acyl-CoA synthetase (AMP-forming)/AMP-acid ligase II
MSGNAVGSVVDSLDASSLLDVSSVPELSVLVGAIVVPLLSVPLVSVPELVSGSVLDESGDVIEPSDVAVSSSSSSSSASVIDIVMSSSALASVDDESSPLAFVSSPPQPHAKTPRTIDAIRSFMRRACHEPGPRSIIRDEYGMTAREALLDFHRQGRRIVCRGADRALDGVALADAVATAAGHLRDRGIGSGDRVAVLGSTTPATLIAILGGLSLGAVVVPLNPRYREAELAHVVSDSGARLALVDAALADRLASAVPELERVELDALATPTQPAPIAARSDDEAALLVYTSGTTGPSKGAELSMRALVLQARALAETWAIDERDVLVLALPLFHVHGLCIALATAIVAGATVHMHARFDAAATIREFAEHGATIFMGVPTMYVQILDHLEREPEAGRVLARARLFTAGSAPLPTSVLARFEMQTGHRILERYGMTETLVTLSNPLVGERRPGSVGRPLPGVDIRIVDDELRVKAPWLMNGYHGLEDATARAFVDGWFCTGDVAVVEVDGYVSIVGRTSTDIVKTGGFKVATREIEDVIAAHPDVADVAVVGVPDERWGERIVACVVAHRHADSVALPAAVVALVRAQLADYKAPREVRLLAELPRNAMGKVEKTRLSALIAAESTPRTPEPPRR